ncbi:PEP-CTERM protein-sorting domain-containing protein [Roseateles sp. YR242]|uniref:PEP-CTERM sorting domain-containing protein n=1 Tax=Roseateles sp. YR242 TaxID=1855305 RepID=UPI0008D7F96B|nr:PEP-CTERM sorting domain-containing protein [Roseateles sp. YR242]SEL70416.1 PEP-CTERM protein-sorting domain-containing protein [Roseateles sp. YR242]
MKTFVRPVTQALALTLGLLCAHTAAYAQFNRPPDSFQSVTVTAGGNTQSDQSTGSSSAPSSVSAAVIGGGAGEPSVSSAFASTTLGAGSVSGSLGTAFAGPGSASAHAEAYLGDTLTFSTGDYGSRALLYFSVVLQGSSETFLDASAVPGGVSGTAGALNTFFMLGIDDHFATWETNKTLSYDGTTLLESYQSGYGPDGRTYGVFNFVADIGLNQAVPLDLYMLLTSDLNSQGVSTNGAAYTDENPGIYWNGISRLTTLDGALLSYTLSSRSGVDYSISAAPLLAPEPASWLLVALGLVPLGAWHRRQRSRAKATPEDVRLPSCAAC